MADKPVFTSDQIVAQLVRLGVWNAPDQPIAFTYLEQRPLARAIGGDSAGEPWRTITPYSPFQSMPRR